MSDNEPKHEPTNQPKLHPGRELKHLREKAGMSLSHIAEQTLISEFRLIALENDDYENVGSVTYVTGYARAYARVVGFDPAPYVAQLEQATGFKREEVIAPAENWHIAPTKRSINIKPLVMLFGGVAALAVIIGLVAVFISANPQSSASDVLADSSPSVELQELNTLTRMAEPTPAASSVVSAKQVSDIPLEVTSRQTKSEFDEPEAEHAAIKPAANKTAVQEADTTLKTSAQEELSAVGIEAQENADDANAGRLELEFTDDCWLRVIDAQGKRLADTIKKAGERLELIGQAPFYVKLGNASAVEIAFNGTDVPVTARSGSRTLELSVGQ